MILRPPPWWTLVDIVAVFVWPDSAEAFGKYLQKQAQARSDARTKVNQEENMLTRNGDSDTDNDSGSFFEVDSIEVFGAVLLASLFAVFCFIYVCFLQCWWRCSERGAFKQVCGTEFSVINLCARVSLANEFPFLRYDFLATSLC